MCVLLYIKQINNYKGERGEGVDTITQNYSSILLPTC